MATFVRTQGARQVFRRRADLQRHHSHPAPGVERLENFFALVDRDQYGCFLRASSPVWQTCWADAAGPLTLCASASSPPDVAGPAPKTNSTPPIHTI
jgi:hypothetical protein